MIRDEEKNPVSVTVNDVRRGAVIFFRKRIVPFPRAMDTLRYRGDDCSAERVFGVMGIEQSRIVRGHKCRKAFNYRRKGGSLALAQVEETSKVFKVFQAVFSLPAPVVPFVVTHVGEVSLSKGDPGTELASHL